MDILFLSSVYKEALWGNESWEICANKDGSSIVKNGEFENISLQELFDKIEYRENIFGHNTKNLKIFPVLNKFINANDKLSIQVHPNDAYAEKFENSIGKEEMWYIVDAKPEAKIIYGFKKNTTITSFKESLENGTLENLMSCISVKKGDIIHIPAGTIHAILDGITIYEIQQNSNITYRLFDWNRTDSNGNPRELHINKALDVIDFNFVGMVKNSGENILEKLISTSNYFKVNLININEKYKSCSDPNTFFAITIVEGTGIIKTSKSEYNISKGNSFIIPATLGDFSIESNNFMQIIKTFY